jgi:hypothetical protein
MGLKEKLCKHKRYIIIDCRKEDNTYKCMCENCRYEFILPKAKNEMYEIGSHIKLY